MSRPRRSPSAHLLGCAVALLLLLHAAGPVSADGGGRNPPAPAAAPTEPTARVVWVKIPGGERRAATLVAPDAVWLAEAPDEDPARVCTAPEGGVCSPVRAVSHAARRTCPTCEPDRHGGLLLRLSEPFEAGQAVDLPGADAPETALGASARPEWISPGTDPPEVRWGVEASASGALVAGSGLAVGGGLRVGYRRLRAFSDESYCSSAHSLYAIIPMIASGGLVCIPPHIWYGNDVGIDVHVRGFAPQQDGGGPSAVLSVGLAPTLLVASLGGGRHRLPSILHVVLPEIGVTLVEGADAAAYLELARVPWSVWLGRHIGLQARAALWVGRPPWSDRGEFSTFAFSATLGLLAR